MWRSCIFFTTKKLHCTAKLSRKLYEFFTSLGPLKIRCLYAAQKRSKVRNFSSKKTICKTFLINILSIFNYTSQREFSYQA